MTTSFSLEFIGSKLTNVGVQAVMKDIASNKNYIYMSGYGTDGNGTELWRTDGTENGTTLVKDINNGSSGSSISDLTVMKDIASNKNYLYLRANDGTNGKELWRTDGTTTTLVKDIHTGSANGDPDYLTVMEDIATNTNYLYFRAYDVVNGYELWRTDGTESGTTLVKDIRAGNINGDPSQLTVMKDIASNKNYLYFEANDGTNGRELWRTDGTESGTTLVKDINTGGNSIPRYFAVMEDISANKNYLYFQANDGTNGSELWRTDGTENGTTLVKDIRTGGNSSAEYLTVMEDIANNKNYLYFRADDGINGQELWRTDGTLNGTTLVKDIRTGGSGSSSFSFTVMEDIASNKNYLYFRADDGTNGSELWRTDGTLNGTTLVKDIRTGSEGSSPSSLVVMKDTTANKNYLYFGAEDVGNEYNLWRSDGTPEGTTFTAHSILHQGYYAGTDVYGLTVMKDSVTNKNYLYFAGAADPEGNIYSIYRLLITNSSTVSVEQIICFKEGTQILTLDLNTGLDTYKNIENINVGDLVSTYKHGNVPVNIIGYSILNNPLSNARITDKMYVYKKEDQPELIEDLYMTGGHCVLRDDENMTNTQCDKMVEEMGALYRTDDKFRLMAKHDYRCDTVDDNRQYRVWHICLDHENETMNYGIYANGMLVESTCERHAQNFLHKKENVVELIKDQCNLTSLLV